MKVAIFHDYLDCIGGGEKVALTIARILKADFITTDVDKDVIDKLGFNDKTIVAIGVTKNNGLFQNGETMSLDPSISDIGYKRSSF